MAAASLAAAAFMAAASSTSTASISARARAGVSSSLHWFWDEWDDSADYRQVDVNCVALTPDGQRIL